ncbi:tryptamine:oxygen oxidoreductase [Lecanicillium sp. MT-2017a]|nr:tryptamine:oxygen oxidoreductase [Lecanicillium sp. MT-2017a]
MFQLAPGYDCPDDAQYMDVQFSLRSQMNIHRNAICFFEHSADYPIQRHTTSSYVSISKNKYFVVRSVAVVGNYDYTIDYTFYLDGSIEVKFRASGYIQGAYYVPGESEAYGYHVHDQFASSLHDHVVNFKADFDILGQQNTLVSVDIEPTTTQYPWAPGENRNTMKLTRRAVEVETGLTWPANAGSHFVVLNNNSLNAWGEKRGYRIMPGSGMGAPSHLTFQGSEALGRAAEWAQKDLWISRQKDTEARSSTPASNFIPNDPMIDFGKFIDGESVVQKDLVVWFNLGNHHVPHSGDIPNTLQHTSASSVWFMPYNFHDRDPSRGKSEGVRLPAPRTHYQELEPGADTVPPR